MTTRIELPDADLSDADAARLAETIAQAHATLSVLDLGVDDPEKPKRKTQFTAEGVQRLAPAIAQCRRQEVVDLSTHQFGGESAATTALASALGNSAATLRVLRLADNGGDEHDVEPLVGLLERCAALEALDLSRNLLGESGPARLCPALAKLTSLRTLAMRFCWLGAGRSAELAPAIAKLTGLRALDWSGNIVGQCADLTRMAEFADALKSCAELRALNLGGNDLEDRGVAVMSRAIQTLARLEYLNLKDNAFFKDEGAAALGTALAECVSLRALIVAENAVGDAGAVALSHGLAQCKGLRVVDLSTNRVGDVGAVALARALQNSAGSLEAVCLESNEVGAEGTAALAGLAETCTSLRTLLLGHNDIGDRGAASLAAALLLGSTSLTKLGMTPEEHRALLASAGGALLQRASSRARRAPCLSAQTEAAGLRTVDLSHCNIGASGALALAEPFATASCANALECVWMGSNPLGEEGAAALMAGLTAHTCERLEELNLAGCGLGAGGAARVAAAVHRFPALNALGLASNELGDDGAAALAEGLVQCPALEVLVLDRNEITCRGAQALARALPKCRALVSVHLSDNDGIDDEGALALATALVVSWTLEDVRVRVSKRVGRVMREAQDTMGVRRAMWAFRGAGVRGRGPHHGSSPAARFMRLDGDSAVVRRVWGWLVG